MRLNQSVAQLNSFLHEELSATGAYKQALGVITDDGIHKALERLERAHEARVEALKKMISSRGGRPADQSPAWTVQGKDGAQVIDELERLENQELMDYRRELVAVDQDARSFVERNILPDAERTYQELEKLKRTIH